MKRWSIDLSRPRICDSHRFHAPVFFQCAGSDAHLFKGNRRFANEVAARNASRVTLRNFTIIAETGKKKGSLTHLVDGTVAAVGTVLRAVGIPLRRLDHLDVQHGALDDDVVLPEVIVGLLVDHQQLGLAGERLDALDHLVVGLVRDVDLVNLDYPIALEQTGRLARRALVHLADKLTVLALLRVQIEAVAVEIVPLDDVAEPGARHLIVLEGGHRVTTHVGLTLDSGGEGERGAGGGSGRVTCVNLRRIHRRTTLPHLHRGTRETRESRA